MRAYLTSGSKLAILPSCAYYARPDVPWMEDSPGEAAKFGTAIHALCESLIADTPLEVTKVAAVPASEQDRLKRVWQVAEEWIQANRRPGWVAEVPLAWDFRSDTARELPKGKHRDYSTIDRDREVPITVDVCTMDNDCAVVIDFKTGRSDLGSYEQQAKASALAWARVTGASSAVARWVKFGEDGAEVLEWRWDAFDLDAIADAFSAQLVEAAELRAEPRPGAHCSEAWCPARASCPATTALLRSHEATAPLVEVLPRQIATAQEAGHVYQLVRRAEDALKQIKDQIREFVERGEVVPTAPGKVLRLVPQTSERFAKSRCPSELLEALRDAGAMEATTSMTMREVKAS